MSFVGSAFHYIGKLSSVGKHIVVMYWWNNFPARVERFSWQNLIITCFRSGLESIYFHWLWKTAYGIENIIPFGNGFGSYVYCVIQIMNLVKTLKDFNLFYAFFDRHIVWDHNIQCMKQVFTLVSKTENIDLGIQTVFVLVFYKLFLCVHHKPPVAELLHLSSLSACVNCLQNIFYPLFPQRL